MNDYLELLFVFMLYIVFAATCIKQIKFIYKTLRYGRNILF